MQGPVIIKLGGSAITDKSRVCTPRLDLIHRVAGEIATYKKQLILLHGGGSFAHPFVTRKLLLNGFKGKSQLERVSEIEMNLDQLTRIIGVALLLRHRSFVPIRPMSFITLRNGNLGEYFLHPLISALELGIIPLIHGDLASDELRGFGVVSADRIASLLGEKMKISRVLFGCDVDGVYASNSKGAESSTPIREVSERNYSGVVRGLRVSMADATGGMRGKVLEAIRLARGGVESYIFNLSKPSNLTRLLHGDSSVGTCFVPWK